MALSNELTLLKRIFDTGAVRDTNLSPNERYEIDNLIAWGYIFSSPIYEPKTEVHISLELPCKIIDNEYTIADKNTAKNLIKTAIEKDQETICRNKQLTATEELNDKFNIQLSDVTKTIEQIDEKHDIAEQKAKKTTNKQFGWSLFVAVLGVLVGLGGFIVALLR